MRSWYKFTGCRKMCMWICLESGSQWPQPPLLVALLVQVLEPAAFLGKPLYNWSRITKQELKENMPHSEKHRVIDSSWFMYICISHKRLQMIQHLYIRVILSAPKKVYQEAAPFPGGLADFVSPRMLRRRVVFATCRALSTCSRLPAVPLAHCERRPISTGPPCGWHTLIQPDLGLCSQS